MKRLCLAALVSLALAAPAQAARPSYSYFDAAYLKDGGTSSEASGFRLGGSASLTRWLYFTGGYDRLEPGSSDLVTSVSSAGFGVHSLKSTFQFFGAATYELRETRSDSVGSSDNGGFGVELGARLPIDFVEFQADYKYFNFGDFPDGSRNDEDRYRVSALAHLTPAFALTSSYETFQQAKNAGKWSVGLRIYFDNRNDMPRRKR